MRAHRGVVVGWLVVAMYAGLVVWATIDAIDRPDVDRTVRTEDQAAGRFVAAWERSRTGTFVASGTYERRSEVSGAVLASEDVVAQRPPRRVHRQLGGVEGRDDDRLVVCPAPPSGQEDQAQPCRLGAAGGPSYADTVAREVAGVRQLTEGPRPLYSVRERRPGCFDLVMQRVDPRAPFGVRASFCFDRATGAVVRSSVRHEGGIVEVVVVTDLRSSVTDRDLEP